MRIPIHQVGIVASTVIVFGTGAAPMPRRAPQPAPRWIVSDTPVISVGDATGDTLRDLLGIESAVRLPNGEIVAASSWLSKLQWFSASGELVRTVGRRGRGPNEFGRAIHLYLERDTLVAHDVSNRRFHRLNARGEFIGLDTIGDDRRPAWVYDRNLVARLPDGVDFDRLQRTLLRIPFSRGQVVRYARVERTGVVWLRGAGDASTFTVHGADGKPLGTVMMPPRFELYDILDTLLLGKWRDDDDIEFIQLRRLTRARSPAISPPSGAPRPAYDQAAEFQQHGAIVGRMRAAGRNLVTAQEMFFATNRRYASALSDLGYAAPPELKVTLFGASPRAFSILLEHPSTRIVCVIAPTERLPAGVFAICG